MLELEAFLVQILPEAGPAGAPFTLKEITQTVSKYYGHIPYSRVHRAWAVLADNPHTAEIVRQLPGGDRELLFSASAARRIVRRAVGSHLPAKYAEIEKYKPKRNQRATRVQNPIAPRHRHGQAVS